MKARNPKRRQQFHIGEKIREMRKDRNLTQAELASRIGIQQSDLCRMETGEYRVSLDALFRILGIFGMGIGEFFRDVDEASDGEQEILLLWRSLDKRGREEVLSFLRFKCRQGSNG